jgi:redox-sensitive bicupin YhaK (pirin superfamily)
MALAASRNVGRVVRARARVRTPHLRILNLSARQLPAAFDPFLGIDHFFMHVPMFPPHPHAGFSALTYLFEDSPGAFVCRDSLGHTAIVAPGDLRWTTAGRGIVHEEVPERPGRMVHGLQIFVNLSAEQKLMPASVEHLTASRVPVATSAGGARVRVVVGASCGVASPLAPPTPITLLDVTVPPQGHFEHLLAPEENAVASVLAGNGTFGPTHRFVRRGDAATFAHDGASLEVRAGREGMRLALLAGAPLRQPIVARGPFIMSSAADVDQAFDEYRLGRMGRLEASF